MITQEEMKLYNKIVALGIATPKEINLVRCCMDGEWMDVLEAILNARTRTGYHTIVQMTEAK